jgi:uncharacterized membrane protein
MKSTTKIKTFIFICCITLVYGMGCDSGEENIPNTPSATDCSTVAATFPDANSIIQSSCSKTLECHANGSSHGPGGLTTFQQIFNAKASIKTAVRSSTMPRGSSLSAAERNIIICWIESGAVNN